MVLSFVLHVPLRVVAPCEIIPNDPILITAPLEQTIDSIKVKPGQFVQKGMILFEYKKEVALQNLRSAEKQTQMVQAELNSALVHSMDDNLSHEKHSTNETEDPLSDVAVLSQKLEKERANLAIAQYTKDHLEVQAPEDGIVMFQDPEEFRGKPVRVGEKVMVLANPDKTKVRIWIPQADNISIDISKPIKVFLNTDPANNLLAKLTYIASFSTLDEKQIPSFQAEAEWLKSYPEIKLGLKGSAILYGEKVSLFYWIFRKPIATTRDFLGV